MTFLIIYSLIIIYIIIYGFIICLKKDSLTIKNFKENIFLVIIIFYQNMQLINLSILSINILIYIFNNNVAYCIDFLSCNTSLISIHPARVSLDFPEIVENEKSAFQCSLEKRDFYGNKEFNIVDYVSKSRRFFSIDRNFLISNIPQTITEIGVDGSFKSKPFISDFDQQKLNEFNNLENFSQKQALSLKYLFEKQVNFIFKKFSTILEINKLLRGSSYEKSEQLNNINHFNHEIFSMYLQMFSIIKVHRKLNTIEKIELLKFLIDQIKLTTNMYQKLGEDINSYILNFVQYAPTSSSSLKISSYLKSILKMYIEQNIVDRKLLIEEIEKEITSLDLFLVEEFSKEIENTNIFFSEIVDIDSDIIE